MAMRGLSSNITERNETLVGGSPTRNCIFQPQTGGELKKEISYTCTRCSSTNLQACALCCRGSLEDDVETLECFALSMVRCNIDNLRVACACVWLEPLLNVLVENLSSPFPAAKHAPLGQTPGERGREGRAYGLNL